MKKRFAQLQLHESRGSIPAPSPTHGRAGGARFTHPLDNMFGSNERNRTPRLQRSLDGLPLRENLNFLMVDPRDDLVSNDLMQSISTPKVSCKT